MSVLISAVAVRHPSPDDVADVLSSLLRDVGHPAQPVPITAGTSDRSEDALVVGRMYGGWVTVHPHYLIQSCKLAVELSRRLGTIASATSIYEDVFWTHDLVSGGRIVDSYVNLPDYFGPGEYGAEYAGDPALVARTVGVDVADVAPYFRQVSLRRARSKFRPPPKAHAADKYHLLDGWVITDLWERMGIAWLGGEDVPYARLTMDHDACQALHAYLS